MTQEQEAGPVSGIKQRRVRGPNKPFPVMSFEEALVLSQGIHEHSVDGQIRRLTLLDRLDLKPSSSKTRNLESSSFKYGLTIGSYRSQTMQITDSGRTLFDASSSSQRIREKQYELAIGQIEPFNRLYERLKEKKFPDEIVLRDELGDVGVAKEDRENAARVFAANLRFLGLVKEVTGSDHVRTIEEVLEDEASIGESMPEQKAIDSPLETAVPVENNGNTAVTTDRQTAVSVENNGNAAMTTNRPALHIDIQVHIDPTSTAEQIDQIFESMARHLYGNES